MLAEAGVSWKQESFTLGDTSAMNAYFAECRKLGGNSTTNVPMLKIDGHYLTQSSAVLRYCARSMRPQDWNAHLRREERPSCHAADVLAPFGWQSSGCTLRTTTAISATSSTTFSRRRKICAQRTTSRWRCS